MAALQQGEEHGVSEYEEALEDKSIDAEIKEVIRDELLPPLREHIATLQSLTES